jgi:hypothetical protein
MNDRHASTIISLIGRGGFTVVFVPLVVILARILGKYGKRFLNHTFRSDEDIVQPVHVLLNLGFYLLSSGLFLWNIGVGGNGYVPNPGNLTVLGLEDAALRLGISIFVIGAFHSINILVIAILNRKSS